MQTKKILTLESVYAAAPLMIFLKFKPDGTVDTDATNASFTVYANTRNRDRDGKGVEYRDRFKINVASWNHIKTLANHLTKGKELHRITCFVQVKEVEIGTNPNGSKQTRLDSIYHLQSVELGSDPESILKEAFLASWRNMVAQGTLPQLTEAVLENMANAALAARRNKPKSVDFDLNTARATGRWINANIWTEKDGVWKGGGQQAQGPVQNQTSVPGPTTGGYTPEQLAAAMALLNQANGEQPKAASAAQGADAPAPGPDDAGFMDEIPF